jgi:hypothetical protein
MYMIRDINILKDIYIHTEISNYIFVYGHIHMIYTSLLYIDIFIYFAIFFFLFEYIFRRFIVSFSHF